MNDRSQGGRIPGWGWLLIIIATVMCVAMVVRALSTGGWAARRASGAMPTPARVASAHGIERARLGAGS